MSREEEVIQAAVRNILDNWDDRSAGASAVAQSEQDMAAYDDEMHAWLWHVIREAIEDSRTTTPREKRL